MNTTPFRYPAALLAAVGVGTVGCDSGVALGLAVVDANRPAGLTAHMAHPASAAGSAGGLVKQLIATH